MNPRLLGSRMECGDIPDDYAHVLCGNCPHELHQHDYPMAECLEEGCECRGFERARPDEYEDRRDEGDE